MKKKEIQLKYKKKIKLLTDYNKNYFDKNNPIVNLKYMIERDLHWSPKPLKEVM